MAMEIDHLTVSNFSIKDINTIYVYVKNNNKTATQENPEKKKGGKTPPSNHNLQKAQ